MRMPRYRCYTRDDFGYFRRPDIGFAVGALAAAYFQHEGAQARPASQEAAHVDGKGDDDKATALRAAHIEERFRTAKESLQAKAGMSSHLKMLPNFLKSPRSQGS